jgi:hypothetical protein
LKYARTTDSQGAAQILRFSHSFDGAPRAAPAQIPQAAGPAMEDPAIVGPAQFAVETLLELVAVLRKRIALPERVH